jgi:phage terminase small subunit
MARGRKRDPIESIQTKLPEGVQPPSGKSQEYHTFFFRVVEISRALGCDSWTDLDSVIELCNTWEEVQHLRSEIVREDGSMEIVVYHGKTGEPSMNPKYRALMLVRAHYFKMLNDFGMTPRARAYVNDKNKSPQNKLAQLLGGVDIKDLEV